MPTCIYCKSNSSASTGVPHVLPEVLAQNELTLPVGSECDACNNYFGNKLDINLARYPDVAFAIQLLGAPGKRGKPREKLGGLTRQRVDEQTVRLGMKVRGRLRVQHDGRHIIEGRVPPEPGFDFRCFRRALHHVGLNYVAAAAGPLAALDPKYDAVRRYIKNPSPRHESWPYCQVTGKDFPRLTGVGFLEYDGTEFIRIIVFQTTFIIDLLPSGLLVGVCRAVGGKYVPRDWTEPPASNIMVGGTPNPS